MDIVNVN